MLTLIKNRSYRFYRLAIIVQAIIGLIFHIKYMWVIGAITTLCALIKLLLEMSETRGKKKGR